MNITNYDLHIVAIVEKGYLQQQLKLLVLSIQQFVKPHLNVKIIACSPRAGKSPDQNFISFLNNADVDFIDKPLNQDHDYFPLCNGIYASDYVARTYKNINSLLLVDTDTLFFNPIDSVFLNSNAIHMRPVDNKGIGSEGKNDSNNDFWDKAFNFFNIEAPMGAVETTVSQQMIRPYYNSGFVLVNKGIPFMQKWKKDFVQLMGANIRTASTSSRHQVDFGFIEQMVLSITCEKMQPATKILPQTYNYPIPFRPKLKDLPKHPKFSELVHVHYHKWFQHPGFLDYVTNIDEKQTDQYLWLKQHLPLLPEINGSFKC